MVGEIAQVGELKQEYIDITREERMVQLKSIQESLAASLLLMVQRANPDD